MGRIDELGHPGNVTTGTWQATAVAVLYGGTGATTASGARANLGVAIGTDVQAYDAGLTSLASADATAGLPYVTAANTWATATYTAMLSVVSGAWKVIGWRESGGQDLTNGAIADGQLMARVGTTVTGVDVSATPAASKVVKADAGGKVDGWVSDADASTKGKLQLTGDLGGTAASPTAVQARGLRDSLGNTRTMSTTTAGYPLVLNSGGQITTADSVSATDVNRALFHVYFYAGTYASDLGSFTTAGTLAEVTSNNRSQTRFSSTTGTAGIFLTALNFQRGMGGKLTIRILPYSTGGGNGRFWLGFISTTSPGATGTPAGPFYGISCDPAAGDTVWYASTADGASISRTSTTKTYNVAHEYVLEATMSATGISVRVADSTNGDLLENATAYTNTTYAPGSGTKFRPYCVSIRTAGTFGFEFVAMFFEANFPNTP